MINEAYTEKISALHIEKTIEVIRAMIEEEGFKPTNRNKMSYSLHLPVVGILVRIDFFKDITCELTYHKIINKDSLLSCGNYKPTTIYEYISVTEKPVTLIIDFISKIQKKVKESTYFNLEAYLLYNI